jgi:hypothetical protein
MSWECKIVEYTDWTEMKIGDMFYGPTESEAYARDLKWDSLVRVYSKNLSNYYRVHNSHRRPLFVVLPGNTLFCVDGQCWSNGECYGGWSVTGDAPLITVQPSINLGGVYHGFLQHGIISPDCEGRQYDEHGYLIRSPR